MAIGGNFLDAVEIGASSYGNVFPNPDEERFGTLYAGFVAFLDLAGAPLWSEHIGSMLADDVEAIAFDPGGRLVVQLFADEALRLRSYAGMTQDWEWSTDQVADAETALVGADAIVLAVSWSTAVDFGAGALDGRGAEDLVLARVRR